MTNKTAIALGLGLLVGILIFFCYTSFVNKSVYRVIINGVFLADTRIDVHSIDAAGNRDLLDTIYAEKTPVGSPVRVGTPALNRPVHQLEFSFYLADSDTAAPQPTVAIYFLQVLRPYTEDLYYGAGTIYDQMVVSVSGEPSTIATLASPEQGNRITTPAPLTQDNPFNALLLAALFFAAITFIVRNADWASVPAFSDLSLGREISSSHEFGTINGLRGIAALLVLLSHTAPGFYGLGVGLTLLLVLSGFLLSKPFILSNTRIFSARNIEIYLTKRLKRILPMYYLYVFILYGVTLELDTALRHFMFVEARGHLWPMTQIFAFYLLLPFLLLITSALHRLHVLLPIAALSSGAFLWLHTMTDWKPFFNGSIYREFHLYAFLIGVAAAYIYYGLLVQKTSIVHWLTKSNALIATMGVLVMFLTILWSGPWTPPSVVQPYISRFSVKAVLSAALIILALSSNRTLFNWLIKNTFFRSVGIVGFSFYILHGLGMQIVLKVQQTFLGIPNPSERSWEFFFASLVVTYAMSLITYSYVERPFFGFKKVRTSNA